MQARMAAGSEVQQWLRQANMIYFDMPRGGRDCSGPLVVTVSTGISADHRRAKNMHICEQPSRAIARKLECHTGDTLVILDDYVS